MKVGDVYRTNNFGYLKVIQYVDSSNVVIEFVATGSQRIAKAKNIRSGEVKDLMMPSVQGVGYIGVGVYTKRSDSYTTWGNMLKRCYSQEYLDKYPTYRGCSVSDDWHNFQVFARWYESTYRDNYELEKDLLVIGNRVYSADTCVFVPRSVNIFITDNSASRGHYPIGVSYDKQAKKLIAKCGDGKGGQKYLGVFTDPQVAHMAWRDCKLKIALDMKPELDTIDERVYLNMVTMINNI